MTKSVMEDRLMGVVAVLVDCELSGVPSRGGVVANVRSAVLIRFVLRILAIGVLGVQIASM